MDKSTEINDLPFKKNGGQGPPGPPGQQGPPNPMGAMGQAPPNPVNTSQNGVRPAQQFAQMPGGPGGPGGPGVQLPPGMVQAGSGPKIGGPGQGISSPEKPSAGVKREFFGLKETDYKSTVVVFALILIFSSTFFFEMLRQYLPAVMQDGKTTLVGSLVAALMGSIIYILIKCVANLN
jgi:hypothetical protein